MWIFVSLGCCGGLSGLFLGVVEAFLGSWGEDMKCRAFGALHGATRKHEARIGCPCTNLETSNLSDKASGDTNAGSLEWEILKPLGHSGL